MAKSYDPYATLQKECCSFRNWVKGSRQVGSGQKIGKNAKWSGFGLVLVPKVCLDGSIGAEIVQFFV